MGKNVNEAPSDQLLKVKLGGSGTTNGIVQYLKENGFSYVNDLITNSNFPLKPHKIEEDKIKIIDPGCSFNEKEGLELLKTAGLLRPTIEDALRFAEQYGTTTIGGKPYIIFLHEPWLDENCHPRILYIGRGSENREFGLDYPDLGFIDYCVLAGVVPHK